MQAVTSLAKQHGKFALAGLAAAFSLFALLSYARHWSFTLPFADGSDQLRRSSAVDLALPTIPRLMPGDTIKLTVYRAASDDKWSERKGGVVSLTPWQEVSGEFKVQPDGSVPIPIIGSFVAAERTPVHLGREIALEAGRLLKSEATASVNVVQQRPFYIVGTVKQPGSYSFVPQMTVLHAVALAGGFQNATDDKWALVEAAREEAKIAPAKFALANALANLAVLKAEKQSLSAAMPSQLVELLGPEKASVALADAEDRRQQATGALNAKRQALVAAAEAARQSVEIVRARTDVLGKGVQSRSGRADDLRQLVNKGSVSRAVSMQAEGDLAELRDRQLIATSSQAEDDAKLSATRQAVAQFDFERSAALSNEVLAQQRQANEARATLQAAVKIAALRPNDVVVTSAQLTYQLVRTTSSGAIMMKVEPTTQLMPGDLVTVSAPIGEPDSVR